MQSRQIRSLIPVMALLTFGLVAAFGQTPDSSGNGLLKGTYHFRHVVVQNVDTSYNPTEVSALWGTISFDGAGNYTLTGTMIDNVQTNGLPQPLNVTATYAIGSGGMGYVVNPFFPTDTNAWMYGAVAQGVFTGSSTEAFGDGNICNDIFIAVPASATALTNAGFTSAYQTGLLDFTAAGSTATKNALFELLPNGKGGFGTITLNGQAANLTAANVNQSIAGASYNFNSDGSATLTIPTPTGVSSTNALFANGTKTMYVSADGNFILGWTSTGYDIFFGVKALAVTGTNALSAGLYFTTALEDSPGVYGTDSYYGAINNTGDAAGDGIVHERLNLAEANSYDFGTSDQITLNSDGSTSVDLDNYTYLFGDAGNAFVGIGTGGNYSLIVGLHAPAFTAPAGTTVFLNPIGVANAASLAPVTASIAPGELILLFGTGLSSTTVVTQGGQVFPTTLGGVSVTIDNLPCPIYYVTPGQLAVSVPYAVAANQTGLANIQVTNNKVASNVIQVYLTDANPGSFSQGANGIGLAAATHAATGQLITASNPAQPGEYLAMFLTGLGTVTPTVADGALGPATVPLSYSDIYNAGNLSVYFNDYGTNGTAGNAGTVVYAGLAPTLAGLYQINVQVPTTGLAAGDTVYVEFATDAADVNQIQIPYGSASGAVKTAGVAAAERVAAGHARAVRLRAKAAAGNVRRAARGGSVAAQ